MTATWDSGFKSSGTTLSGGNLVATFNATASGVACTRKMTGKTYWEVTIGGTLANVQNVGIVNAQSNMGAGQQIGAGTNGCGYAQSGAVTINGSTISTIQTFAAGNTICIACDIFNQLIWFRVGAGNWNNNAANNPATGVGGISLATLAASGSLGPVFPAASANSASDSATAIFASGSFTQSPPAGFSAIDTNQIVSKVNGAVAPRGVSFTQYGAARKATLASPQQRSSLPANSSALYQAWYGGNAWRVNPTFLWTGPATTAVSGNVEEQGVNVSGKTVIVFDNTGKLIGVAISGGGGAYSIPALGRSVGGLWAVAFDPFNYQMLGYDRI